MSFSRISNANDVSAYAKSYEMHHDILDVCQILIPFGGVIFSAGVLLHDLKAWVINKIFVDTQLQAEFAAATYNKKCVQNHRIYAVWNILTGGIVLLMLNLIALAINLCCCPKSSEKEAAV